jgi:hypothetical protein
MDTVRLSEWRTVTLLYNINQMDFVRMMQYVFCGGETVFLNTIYTNFTFQMAITPKYQAYILLNAFSCYVFV